MPREYAVIKPGPGGDKILYRTAGFTEDSTCIRQPLSDGACLLIAGTDDLEEENRVLKTRLEESLSANHAKDAFLSSMSHDISTPMNAIIGMTALAGKHIDEKDRVVDALSKIETASDHLLSLINEVLDMSRINSGVSVLSEEAFSLSDLLHETLTIVKPLMEKKGHAFHTELGSILCEDLFGDTLRLRQIFVNIISNAAKYTPAGGQIDVSISEELSGDLCTLSFACRDNGIGMSKDFIARIFTPFERASTSTVSGIEGTGLGMSIVKRLIDMMHGTIGIESEEGKGTAVSIRIPLQVREAPAPSYRLNGTRLMIIEGDEELRDLYKTYLTDAGAEAVFAMSAQEAVSLFSDAEFSGSGYDAVLIGRSTGDSGSIFDIAGYLHKSHPQLPIVLVSEHNWETIEYQAGRSGISHFIPLPFFRKSLLRSLGTVLDSSAAEGTASSASIDLTGRNILLVEDNLINMEIASEILASTNAGITRAGNGQEALEAFEASVEGFFDLILMDIQMPVMDGYTATKRIRSLDRKDAGTVIILAMTANAFAEDIANARSAGMNGHLAKPIDIARLMTMLRQYLQ